MSSSVRIVDIPCAVDPEMKLTVERLTSGDDVLYEITIYWGERGREYQSVLIDKSRIPELVQKLHEEVQFDFGRRVHLQGD